MDEMIGTVRRTLSMLLGLTAAALVVAACADLERPEGFSPSPEPSLAIGEGQVFGEDEAARAEAPDLGNDFVPSPEPGFQAPLLIAAGPSALIADGTGPASLIDEPLQQFNLSHVADDLGGNLILDELGGPISYAQSQVAIEQIDDSSGELLGVGHWGGAPRAFVLQGGGEIDWIRLVSEQDGNERERRTHIELSVGETLVDLSASQDLQAVITSDDECGQLRFFGAEGTELSLPAPDDPECTFPGSPAYGSVALSPDAQAVAYTIVTYRDDGSEAATELIVREILSKEPYLPVRRIGEDLDRITSLTFDGQRVAYIKETDGERSIIIIEEGENDILVPTGTVNDLRAVAFARLPLNDFDEVAEESAEDEG